MRRTFELPVWVSAAVLAFTGLATAQTPTPTPIDSNVAVTNYAQNHGIDLLDVPCTTRGSTGCGGCYPAPLPSGNALLDAVGQLNEVNPEWQPIGPMLVGGDPSLPPHAAVTRVTGTITLSKSPGDDFPATHMSPDYNAEILPDDNSQLATGNGNHRVEFEWEGNKYPLYAWAGEGDRMTAEGRWIFDCGHPDPSPVGKCSNNATRSCIVDSDCSSPGTCTNPVPNFGFQSELHPPQAVAMIRNKSLPAPHAGRTAPAIPATRADVYISADGGGAGDRCNLTHLQDPNAVLFNKACILSHCSISGRPCATNKDCPTGQTCFDFDPALRVANINASNFEFDMPLPSPPPGSPTLKIVKKNHKPKGGQMPQPTFQVTMGPTPNLHVIVPMATPLPNGHMPNVFAQSISAGWKEDTTSLTHVQVKFKSMTINNPVKDSTPVVSPRQCLDPSLPSGSQLTGVLCTTEKDCPASVCVNNPNKACHSHHDCGKNDVCTNPQPCMGGITPGWRMWGQVNGDWVQFSKLETLGAKAPFLTPPFVQPTPALKITKTFTFNEFVPPTGSIHLKVSGRSDNCLNTFMGHNLIEGLNEVGITLGGTCLLAGSRDPGTVEVTHNGPNFGTAGPGQVTTFTATSAGGDGGTCSVTTTQLCVTDADCPSPQTCNVTSGAYTLEYTIKVIP